MVAVTVAVPVPVSAMVAVAVTVTVPVAVAILVLAPALAIVAALFRVRGVVFSGAALAAVVAVLLFSAGASFLGPGRIPAVRAVLVLGPALTPVLAAFTPSMFPGFPVMLHRQADADGAFAESEEPLASLIDHVDTIDGVHFHPQFLEPALDGFLAGCSRTFNHFHTQFLPAALGAALTSLNDWKPVYRA